MNKQNVRLCYYRAAFHFLISSANAIKVVNEWETMLSTTVRRYHSYDAISLHRHGSV